MKRTILAAGLLFTLSATLGTAWASRLALANVVSQTSQSPRPETAVYLVEFKQRPSVSVLSQISGDTAIRSIARFDAYPSPYFERLYRAEVANASAEAIERLKANPLVARVEASRSADLLSIVPSNETSPLTDDPFFNHQWALWNNGQTILREVDDIHSERASASPLFADADIGWRQARTLVDGKIKRDLVVAVIDSGLDVDHEDLQGSIAKNDVECEDGKIPFKPTQDKDGNGYVGDCMGWNFTSNDQNGDNNPIDDLGHGTHVAGIIAAQSGNGKGISGFSNHIKVLPIKVTSKKDGAKGGVEAALTHRVAKAVLYAIKRKVDVINFSLGWPLSVDSEFLRQSFQAARQAGITIVAAAGNNNHSSPVFPCAYDGVVCVGAMGINGEMASFSNFGGHVDFLAPGEEILSTHPKTIESLAFSVNGYEVKSGTSQAAPYVSAVIAALKGVFPGITEDEIIARLTLGSRPTLEKEKFALGGAVQLSGALAAKKTAVVLPSFKDLGRVAYRDLDRKFQLHVPVASHWMTAPNVEIRLRSLSPAVRLAPDHVSLGSVAAGTAKTLSLDGRILDSKAHSDARMELQVWVDGRNTGTYRHDFVISRDITEDPAVRVLPIQASGGASDLLTVRSFLENETNPEYYHFGKVEGGIQIKIVRLEGNAYVELNPIVLPNAITLLSLYRVDINRDGRPDYFIGSVYQNPTSSEKGIQYSYFDENLQPLYGAYSNMHLVVDGAVLTEDGLKTLKFMPLQTPHLGTFLAPVFFTEGMIPKPDLNPNPLDFETNFRRNRIYYFEPILKNGEAVLNTRSFDNFAWEKALREKLKLRSRSSIEVTTTLPQSDLDFDGGTVRAIIGVGTSSALEYYMMSIHGRELTDRRFTLEPMNLGGESLAGSTLNSVIELGDSVPRFQASAAFAAFFSRSVGRVTYLDENTPSRLARSLRTSPARPQDSLVSFVQAYRDGDRFYGFFQSKSHLILRESSSRGEKSTEQAIKRSSLLPGKVFNELFFPIFKGEPGSRVPALYVDATQLSSRHVYIWTKSEDGLAAPIDMNIEVPNDCRSLAPRPFGPERRFAYVFLCQEKSSGANQTGRWVFKVLDMD